MPKPTIGQVNWGDDLNDYLDDLESASVRAIGRSDLLLYHDFSDDADGNPNGRAVDEGGVNWATTGTVAPVVTSGKLSSTGSGYLYTTLSGRPLVVEADVSFGGTGNDNSSCTIAICKTAGATLINDIAHMIFGPSGASLQMNKDATGGFDFNLSAEWPEIPKDGTRARVKLAIVGDTATIIGPDGRTSSTTDRRIGDTLGTAYQTVFWQASTSSATDAYLHTCTVWGSESSGTPSFWDRVVSGIATIRTAPARLVGAANKAYQVSIGGGNGANSGYPTVGFGTASTGQDSLRAILLASASIGGTSISLDQPLYGYSTVTIGYGNAAETVSVSSTSGTGSPYTITVGALTKNHSANEPVTAATTRYKEIYLDMANGLLFLPTATAVNGVLEFGNARDTTLQRSATATLSMPSGGSFRVGRNTTANRPSASTVGQGAMFFDTTLNKPIWSNGTSWVLADGTAA